MEQKHFYHCFPRNAKNSPQETKKGLAILQSMCEIGLLITPEVMPVSCSNLDGSIRKEQIFQQSISFTRLSPNALKKHFAKFGRFALEYDLDSMYAMNAMPTFSIPKNPKAGDSPSLGSTLLIQLLDAMRMAERMGLIKGALPPEQESRMSLDLNFPDNPNLNKTFSLHPKEAVKTLEALQHALPPFPLLTNHLNGLLNYFYPADDERHGLQLSYYDLNEWRLAGSISINGVELMRQLTESEKTKLKKIDKRFFSKPVKLYGKELNFLDHCFVFSKIGNEHVLERARRVIVPTGAKVEAMKILSVLPNPPKVVERG